MILEARNLCRVYGSTEVSVTALHDANLQLHGGEFVALIGKSGSGKSTLLHLLGGLDRPTQGEVLLEGRPFASLDDQERSLVRRRRIGFVFQKINLLPTLTAEENVALPLLIDGVARDNALGRAREALATVQLSHRASHRPSELSGGEQQRVAIARALVIQPAVILADEPTGSLDRAGGQQIVELLRSCVASGRTVVIVTHDPEIVAQADRRITVSDGRLQVMDQPSTVPVDPQASTP